MTTIAEGAVNFTGTIEWELTEDDGGDVDVEAKASGSPQMVVDALNEFLCSVQGGDWILHHRPRDPQPVLKGE